MNIFQTIAADFGALALFGALAVMFMGGFTKGVVGFALPMISVSGIGSIMTADMAILALLLPGLVTNVWQAFRSGVLSAMDSLRTYWRIFAIMPVVLAMAAQAFTVMSDAQLFLVLGVVVIAFAVLELSHHALSDGKRHVEDRVCSNHGARLFGGRGGSQSIPYQFRTVERTFSTFFGADDCPCLGGNVVGVPCSGQTGSGQISKSHAVCSFVGRSQSFAARIGLSPQINGVRYIGN